MHRFLTNRPRKSLYSIENMTESGKSRVFTPILANKCKLGTVFADWLLKENSIIMIAEQLHTRLLENMTTAVLLLDGRMCLSHINNAAETLLGLSGNRHHGQQLADLLVNPATIIEVIENTREQGATHTERHAIWKTKSGGELITNRVDYTVSRIDDIVDTELVIEIQPIDRILEINREVNLVTAQSANDALLKGLAHEIKNPLGGIRGAAQLLETELSNKELLEYTNIIVSETDRLRNLVDRMLGPRQPFRKSAFNVHKVLERVGQLVNNTAQETKIQLIKDYDPSIPSIVGDEEQLIQVFLNIAVNAVQAINENASKCAKEHSAEPPSIRLRSRIIRHFTIGQEQHKLACRLSIEDNGPGVPEEMKEKMFVPMVSGYASNSGLGLAIAQQIVNRHKGLIICESEPGDTKFFVYLPIDSGE